LAALALLAVGGASAQSPARAEAPRVAIIAPERLRQGDPLLAWVAALPEPGEPDSASFAQAIEALLADASGKTIARARCFDATALLGADAAALPGGGSEGARLFGALFALAPTLPPGDYSILASGASSALTVELRDFPLETIPLDTANAQILTKPSKRKDDEARKLVSILAKVDGSALFAEGQSFLFPAEGGFRSASFGDRRRYLYPDGKSDTSVHGGVDWGVVKGTPVRACERGRVAFVADREVTGRTLVLEHLPGLYSLYFHLSSIEVEEGRVVERGERIALSGSTGLSTGPHLHWELRARGDAVDPELWLGAPLLDKNAIMARITALIEGR